MAAFSNAWDEDSPAGSDLASTIDNKMQDHRTDLGERLEDMFYGFDASDNSGVENEYGVKYLKFYPQDTPSTDADYGFSYAKTVNTEEELHYLNGTGQECQITKAGKINLSGNIPADAIDEDDIRLDNNSYLTSRNFAGDGDINLIKVNASNVPEVLVGAVLSASTAPGTDPAIANKKYVDDQISAIQDPTYSGGESHTFDGGLIFKQGIITSVTALATGSVSFGAAFSTVVSASCTAVNTTSIAAAHLHAFSTSALSVRNASSTTTTDIYWQAWGY